MCKLNRPSKVRLAWIILAIACVFSSSARANRSVLASDQTTNFPAQHGIASWHRGTNQTTSGERWSSEEFVAAHRNLPLGTRVRVINVKNGKSTVVRVTDRGPHVRGRVIDLSPAAARQIGLLEAGVMKVRVEIVSDLTTPLIPTKPSV